MKISEGTFNLIVAVVLLLVFWAALAVAYYLAWLQGPAR